MTARMNLTSSSVSSTARSTLQTSYDYLDAGGEQDIVAQTSITNRLIESVWIDLSNMTQDGTIILYAKEAGLATYTEFKSISWVQGTGPNLLQVDGFPTAVTSDWKMSWTEGGDEGDDRAIGYTITWVSN